MIYLDNSATTRPYPEVIESFTKVATQYFGNPSSVHALGSEAERLIMQARENIATLMSVHPREIIFTSGGTEGNNIAVKGTALKYRKRGKHIITTSIEHASIHEGFKQLEANGYDITYLPVNEDGHITVDQVKEAIRKDTILVSIIHVNNEVGSIQPVKEIGEMLAQHSQVLYHVDYVQGIGKVPLSIREAKIDLLTASGHKFHGMKGTGFLYVRKGLILEPLFTGGSQESQLRAGTENVPGIVSMARALRMTLENIEQNISELEKLKQRLMNFLSQMTEVVINTPVHDSAPHIVNFSVPGTKPEALVHLFEEYNIYVSTKSACSSKDASASRILIEMQKEEKVTKSAIRVSMSAHTSEKEIDAFCLALKEILTKKIVIKR
ncbi:cysteine desulfurase family protein [Bacillus suaedaesalsae]|uniref:Cysteine desulfurase n=1 Tax=Bacillus suaedaesalsae TaxID=2810349 RepID=A0ABS2DG26_9BACI|nr:cysteine desulfurase family protein [Bacillus suaedaesalsae]MBM6617436.1 cysteine desulfurase [Bacillus suaedaesalsae]